MSRNGHHAPDTNSTADYSIAIAEPPATVTKTLNPYSSKALESLDGIHLKSNKRHAWNSVQAWQRS